MLRIIAFTTMAIDHIGMVFFPQYLIFRIIGRLALPLFAFNIAQGYTRTRDVFKYGQRLFLLALISQPIFYLVTHTYNLNICFTLLVGLISIYIYDKQINWFIKIIGISALLFLTFYFNLEYGIFGVLMVLFFYIFRSSAFLIIAQSLLVFASVLTNVGQFIYIFAIPSFFLAYYFKKYDFRINRTVQYLFYPAHLLIIYLISLIVK